MEQFILEILSGFAVAVLLRSMFQIFCAFFTSAYSLLACPSRLRDKEEGPSKRCSNTDQKGDDPTVIIYHFRNSSHLTNFLSSLQRNPNPDWVRQKDQGLEVAPSEEPVSS